VRLTFDVRAQKMRLALVIALATLSLDALAWPSPREAIEEFLKFELAGGRLQSWQFKRYLAVDDDHDEPGWDVVHVVEGAKVLSLACGPRKCTAKVEFTYAPTESFTSPGILPHPKGGSETIEYTIVRAGGEWLLQSTRDCPRVSYLELKRRGTTGL
jgi:hypothetical protein